MKIELSYADQDGVECRITAIPEMGSPRRAWVTGLFMKRKDFNFVHVGDIIILPGKFSTWDEAMEADIFPWEVEVAGR
jgi:hypothetical protein